MNNYSNVVFKKNIILIPEAYDGLSKQKGVLSLSFKQDCVEGDLRCYNVKPTDEVFSVGVQIGDSTFKTKATAKELTNLKIKINTLNNNSSKVSVVIVSLNSTGYETLLWGSSDMTRAIEEDVQIKSLLEKTQIIASQQQKYKVNNFNQNKTEVLHQKQEEIFEDEMLENYIDKMVEESSVDHKQKSSPNVSLKNNTSISSEDDTFYSKVENQINNFFDNNQPDEILENIIPDSKFCKVSMDSGYYVFGVIYENKKEKCICYGIPCEQYDTPPKEIEGYSQWLPIDADNYNGKGYWLTYQDAITGENISVEII